MPMEPRAATRYVTLIHPLLCNAACVVNRRRLSVVCRHYLATTSTIAKCCQRQTDGCTFCLLHSMTVSMSWPNLKVQSLVQSFRGSYTFLHKTHADRRKNGVNNRSTTVACLSHWATNLFTRRRVSCVASRGPSASVYIYTCRNIWLVICWNLEVANFSCSTCILRPLVGGALEFRQDVSFAYLCTCVGKKIDLHTFIHCAAIQKCHGILERQWAH